MSEKNLNIFDDGDYYDVATGNTYLMPMKDKIKYYEMITKITIPKVKPYEIVRIIFHKKKDIVIFNGLAGYKSEYGGFSFKGFIELERNYIGISYDLRNDNNYQYIGFFLDNINDKGKVK